MPIRTRFEENHSNHAFEIVMPEAVRSGEEIEFDGRNWTIDSVAWIVEPAVETYESYNQEIYLLARID